MQSLSVLYHDPADTVAAIAQVPGFQMSKARVLEMKDPSLGFGCWRGCSQAVGPALLVLSSVALGPLSKMWFLSLSG